MSTFLNSLRDKLTAMEQEMQTLPGELDAIVMRLDRSKLRDFSFRLNQVIDNLLDGRFNRPTLGFPPIIQSTYPFIRGVTNEDLQRWREAYRLEVRVIIGRGRVALMVPSELASKYKTTASQIIFGAQQQGYIVLSRDQYQKLLDEIGKLIAGSEKTGGITDPSGTIMGIPLPTTSPEKPTKLLT
jgi:hypothetical protein